MGSRKSPAAAACLSDDLVVEILSHLPARSLFRFKCVSRSWRDLISDPDHRGKLAQTVSGFFYYTVTETSSLGRLRAGARFVALGRPAPGGSDQQLHPNNPMVIDPAFPFLPPGYYGEPGAELLDSCNGLLLLRGYRRTSPDTAGGYFFYVVCNPTTRRWVELPQPRDGELDDDRNKRTTTMLTRSAALAFDPADSSQHFHVFRLVESSSGFVEAVEIYSSETGRWDLRSSGWVVGRVAYAGGNLACLHGVLYFRAGVGAVASVDATGQAWGLTSVVMTAPFGEAGFIGRSRGRLLYVDVGPELHRRLDVYALETGPAAGDEPWTLLHRANESDVFGPACFGSHLMVAAVHQDCNRIFLFDRVWWRIIAYDMDRRDTSVACDFTRELGSYACKPFFPYVPLYSPQALSL